MNHTPPTDTALTHATVAVACGHPVQEVTA